MTPGSIVSITPIHQGNDWITDFHVTTPEGTEVLVGELITDMGQWQTTIMGNMFWAVAPSFDARVVPNGFFDITVVYAPLNGMTTSTDVVIEYTMDVIPEPGTLAILGLGLAGLGLARRKMAA